MLLGAGREMVVRVMGEVGRGLKEGVLKAGVLNLKAGGVRDLELGLCLRLGEVTG